MSRWRATHRITFATNTMRRTWVVKLDANTGMAPTAYEHRLGRPAVWERNLDGEWRYLGAQTPENRVGSVTVTPIKVRS